MPTNKTIPLMLKKVITNFVSEECKNRGVTIAEVVSTVYPNLNKLGKNAINLDRTDVLNWKILAVVLGYLDKRIEIHFIDRKK